MCREFPGADLTLSRQGPQQSVGQKGHNDCGDGDAKENGSNGLPEFHVKKRSYQ